MNWRYDFINSGRHLKALTDSSETNQISPPALGLGAVAAPSSIAVLKPHLRYLLVSDTHAVTSDTRPHYEPTTASQNRQVISNPNDGVTGERRDKKRSYKLTIARCTPTMRGAPPFRAKGRSAGATT